jgi:hypothetical protein
VSDQELEQNLQEFLEVRMPGANHEEPQKEEHISDIPVDLENYRNFRAYLGRMLTSWRRVLIGGDAGT